MPLVARRPRRLRCLFRRAGPVLLAAFAIATLAPPAAAATETIRITDRLSRPEVVVAPGTTIRWINRDDERHRMRSQSGPQRFDSGNLEPGESFSVRLMVVGTYRYLDERDDENRRYAGTIVVRSDGGGTSGGGSAGDDGATEVAEVRMAGRAFGPSTVRITAGATVTFRNDDDREHTVTSTSGAFDSGVLGEGSVWRHRFLDAGTFPFLCAIHRDMTGEIVVIADAAGAAPPAATVPAPSPTPAASPAATPAPTPMPSATATPASTSDASPSAVGVTTGTGRPTDDGSAAPRPTAAPAAPGVGSLLRLGLVALLVGAAVALFMRTISGSVRRPA